jgi:hypothetical protein
MKNNYITALDVAADGEHTVAQLIAQLGSRYEGGAPAELPHLVHAVVAILVSVGLLRLSDFQAPAPYYLASPFSEQAPQKAKRLMIEDGIIRQLEPRTKD